MEISISVFWMVGIIIVAIVLGYFIGRNELRLLRKQDMGDEQDMKAVWDGNGEERPERTPENRKSVTEEEHRSSRRWGNGQQGQGHRGDGQRVNGHRGDGHYVSTRKVIASPVSGKVHYFCEGARRGVEIEPDQGMVYAPMSGKITRLYPMGNAFILRSQDGGNPIELLIRVGRQTPDELCSTCYRSHIMQNEIVNKGKLLLMFDKERLQEAGESVSVFVSPEAGFHTEELTVTTKECVKPGEDLMWY